MKKVLVLVGVLFIVGCSNPYYARLNELNERLEYTKARDYKAREDWEQLVAEESDFISRLNDEQLAAYQNLSNVYATGNPAAEESAHRQLEKCLDADSYAKAAHIMQEKDITRLRIAAVGRSYRNLQREGEDLDRARQRQRQAVGDYMLRESIRSVGRYPY